jgi:threonyl-tRNA synthetase
MPISDRHFDYANEGKAKLEAVGMRVELDDRNEKIGYKIREARMQRVPYMLVMGDSEVADGTLSVRSRKDGDLGAKSVDEFIADALVEINTKANGLDD